MYVYVLCVPVCKCVCFCVGVYFCVCVQLVYMSVYVHMFVSGGLLVYVSVLSLCVHNCECVYFMCVCVCSIIQFLLCLRLLYLAAPLPLPPVCWDLGLLLHVQLELTCFIQFCIVLNVLACRKYPNKRFFIQTLGYYIFTNNLYISYYIELQSDSQIFYC